VHNPVPDRRDLGDFFQGNRVVFYNGVEDYFQGSGVRGGVNFVFKLLSAADIDVPGA
jgi:hypothetical protein